MTEQYNILIQKLDAFIRKYYKNQLIKGGIYCFSLLIVFFLIANLFEYFGQFDTLTRTITFYVYLALNAIIIYFFIIVPLFKLFKIGKIISREQAAQIIGEHFSYVGDKLLNTLQLANIKGDKAINLELVNASIDQKIFKLKPIPFGSAINFKKNGKYLRYAAPPLLIFIVIILAAPSMITEPTTRLVKHGEYFEKQFPFSIKVLNENFDVIQNDDFRLEVKLEGDEIPDQVLLETGNNRIVLNKENPVSFNYVFNNVQKPLKFNLIADQFKSDSYELTVLPKPIILDFEITLDYPDYTGKKDETISKNGDLIIPLGTEVGWTFFTKNTEEVSMRFLDEGVILEKGESNRFNYLNTFYESQHYSINSSNEFLRNSDSLSYSINVIPDIYPMILVEQFQDSVLTRHLYFKGAIKDDYGFSKLTFNYKITNETGIDTEPSTEKLDFSTQVNPQQIFHYFDIAALEMNAGDEVEYYFEVWDNDRINGSKSSRSQIMTFKIPDLNEINKQRDESNQDIKDEMEDALKETQELQKDIEDLAKKMVDKKELNWEDKQQIQSLLDKQKELQEKLEAIKKSNEEKALKEQQYKEVNEELAEKQKQLEELFEKLMENEELKELFDELRELLDEVDKDKVSDMLEQMKMSNEELEQMLDRNLELFKQLEFETKLEETIEKMNELSEKQEKLSEETLDKKNDEESLKAEQEEIQKEFDELSKDLEDLEKINEELEDPNNFDKMEEEQENVNQDMEDSQNSMDKNQRKKASKSQQDASEKMQEMANSLFEMQQEMISEGMGEDIDALRDILENLIQLSFDQEDLIDKVNDINLNDPQYTDLVQEQKKIKDDLKIVEDSLFALSKRQIMIEPFITKEVNSINQNIEKSMDFLNNRQTNQASSRQQYAMTSINNLALMLSETLNQMMQSMQMQGECNSSCKSGKPKPGAGSPSMKSMRQLQEQLNKQIESLKKGKKEGGKEGEKAGQFGQSMSEKLARMAAEQEAIRNEMGKLSEQLNKEGQFGASKEIKKVMEEMEKTETDLVNKMVTQETLLRQKEILTRLLKSEKAELEREKEEKRESTEAFDQEFRNPEKYFEYNGKELDEVELLKTMPPSLKPFYKSKVNQYFYKFEELLD